MISSLQACTGLTCLWEPWASIEIRLCRHSTIKLRTVDYKWRNVGEPVGISIDQGTVNLQVIKVAVVS